jgi:hypothetical protein
MCHSDPEEIDDCTPASTVSSAVYPHYNDTRYNDIFTVTTTFSLPVLPYALEMALHETATRYNDTILSEQAHHCNEGRLLSAVFARAHTTYTSGNKLHGV